MHAPKQKLIPSPPEMLPGERAYYETRVDFNFLRKVFRAWWTGKLLTIKDIRIVRDRMLGDPNS